MQSERLDRAHKFENPRDALLANTVKLMEESGELADAILAMHKLQRKEKVGRMEVDALALECADVIITTLILAQRAGVDINKALSQKIVKINRRFGKFDRKK
jgi:NTP pyrophosphatase (non-canonical NTP hydrolase)